MNLFPISLNSFMSRKVREPIQVYLTDTERARLDRVAREMGVSRSEVLRRGIEAVGRTRRAGPLRDLVEQGFVTPSVSGPGEPPPSAPVAPLADILCELDQDREDR